MTRLGTLLGLLLAVGALAAPPALAQPARNGIDAQWARDVGAATLTLDGALNEPQWAQAQSVLLLYNNPTFTAPGGGWQIFDGGRFNVPGVEPVDPVNATVKLLRRGNILWVGVTALDRSVGGAPIDFWTNDGVVMSILDERNRPADTQAQINFFGQNNTDEFFYTYFSADTTAGALPALFGNEGGDRALWDGRTTIQGTANNDADTDTGYTQELRIDLSLLGVDMTRPGGDRLPISFTVFDFDYKRSQQQSVTRAWWQNAWGGDMPFGVGFVYGRPDVTVASGAAPPLTTPELRLPTTTTPVAIDGRLNEGIWGAVAPQVTLQYQATTAELDQLPGFGPFYTSWFRPGGDAPGAPPVVDPSEGRIRFIHQGDRLIVGFDTDDQAVSTAFDNEDRADGLRIILRERSNTAPGETYLSREYYARIAPGGTLRVRRGASGADTTGTNNPAEVLRGLFLKPGTTAGDPSNVDAGYQMELSIDLRAIPGYTAGLGDRQIWIGAAYYDGDVLPDDSQSYGMHTWWLNERGGGIFSGPAAQAFLDPTFVVAGENAPTETAGFRVVGAVPNPSAGQTSLRYALPAAADVTVEVFDVLGRLVATVAPGAQAAGEHAVSLDVSAMSPGTYAVRIRLADGATASGRFTVLR